jgi:hypothetical protein
MDIDAYIRRKFDQVSSEQNRGENRMTHQAKQRRAMAARIQALTDKTADAYSRARYGAQWPRLITLLTMEGYSDKEIEGIVRSKIPRWADSDPTPMASRVIAWMHREKNLRRLIADIMAGR